MEEWIFSKTKLEMKMDQVSLNSKNNQRIMKLLKTKKERRRNLKNKKRREDVWERLNLRMKSINK